MTVDPETTSFIQHDEKLRGMAEMALRYSALFVGAGQIGSRHLQGFVDSEVCLDIFVVDPSPVALETARTRWIEASGAHCKHKICWLESIPKSLERVDLVLVATSAKRRADLTKWIARKIEVRFWVIEKVLAQSVEELEVISQATRQSRGAWVNKPMRMMAWHQALRKALISKGPIKASYSGGLWGLACNSIHYLDLLCWWTGEKLTSIDISGLDSVWFAGKRAGYFEVTGRLLAHYSGGTTLELEARHGMDSQSFQVQLEDGTLWEINEVNGTALSTNAERRDGCVELQSQLSARLVDGILLLGKCELPTLEESTETHAIFLDAMLKHWNLSQNRTDLGVPIT